MSNAPIQSVAMPASGTARHLAANSPPFVPSTLISSASAHPTDPTDLRQAFRDFVAGTFYSQMIKALRKNQDKPAYFHGGMAEDIFQAHLDRTVAENLARTSGDQWIGPLFNAFVQRLRLRVNQSGS